jgi:ketosteroid isomerase-like protein
MPDDDAAIRSLIGRAAHLGDEGDPDDYRSIYTADATWVMGSAEQHGIEEIVSATAQRRREGVSGPGTATRHFVTPLHVDVAGDTATAHSYFLFLGDTTGTPVIRLFGTYTDRLLRTADGWRIQHRTAQVG